MSQRRIPFRPRFEEFEDRLCPSSTVTLPIATLLSQQDVTPPELDGWAYYGVMH